ncbi:hypothetical protein M595_4805 [Lyngbya aestuarii BL J]|uniref:Uncharacterized protein n=1 Tax=Lyngbya aestuarii BL J TaxID=1348334 RepID=U7QBQ5_9CYAN|nr:hypothetical protein M595_4805 [Lyngbya aestuarii BL J]
MISFSGFVRSVNDIDLAIPINCYTVQFEQITFPISPSLKFEFNECLRFYSRRIRKMSLI